MKHRTMSECSYHGAMSSSFLSLKEGHFTVIEPSKFQNETEIFQYKCIVLSHKYQNARKLQFSDFGTLLSYHKLAYISCDTGITVTEGKIKKQLLFKKFRMKMKKKYGDIKTFTY